MNNEEYLKLINNQNHEYFYDGIEEIFSNSDSDDDERLVNNNNRMSFTREQLVEYQQLIKLLRFIKVYLIKISFFFFFTKLIL
jgi:hypothetical protein